MEKKGGYLDAYPAINIGKSIEHIIPRVSFIQKLLWGMLLIHP